MSDNVRSLHPAPEVPRPPSPDPGSSVQGSSVQGTLALGITPETAPPDVRTSTSRSGADVVLVNPRTSDEAKRWSTAFATAVVEVIAGDRPASQLVRWCTPSIHQEISRRADLVAAAGGHRAGHGRPRHGTLRPQVTSVRTCFLTSATVEMCAVVRHGRRSRFLAARIERWSGRWCCTVLEFG